MKLSPYTVLASAVFACLLAGGCGSHQPTKADVIAQASQICETAASSVRAVPPPAGQSPAALARYYEQVVPIVQAEVKRLKSLPRPAQDRALLERYLDSVAISVSQFQQLAAAARRGDRAALASESAALRSNPASSLATRYGITRCGGSLGTAAS